MTTTLSLISKQTVGANGASSVTFSNIPQTYTDLKLVSSTRASASANGTNLSFNGISPTVSTIGLVGTGSSASSYSGSNPLGGLTTESSYTANTFSSSELYIPNYTSSNYKSSSLDTAQENNATSIYMQFNANLWQNTSAITSITLTPETSNSFVQYSTFYLYGINNS